MKTTPHASAEQAEPRGPLRRRPRALLALLTVAVLCGQADAQRSPLDGGDDPVAFTPPQPELLHGVLNVGAVQCQQIDLPAWNAAAAPAPVSLRVLLDGQVRTLRLAPHSLRALHYRLLVDDGTGPVAAASPPPRTYRGRVDGFPTSVVAASLTEHGLRALVRLAPDRAPSGIQPLATVLGAPADTSVVPAPGRRAHVVYDATDALPSRAVCGLLPGASHEPATNADPSPSDGGATIVRITDIACDTDVEFWQQNGFSVSATEADIENVLNGVEAIYADDVAIVFEITTIIVRTGSVTSDPYTTTVSELLLDELDLHWTTQQQGVVRDVAHLFTGKNLFGFTIGLTKLNTVCSTDAYGLSQSRYTTNFTNRVALTAHEIGHNFNAVHCNAAPPCWIMCASIGACGPVTSFAPGAADAINMKKAVSLCLDQLPPDTLPTLATADPGAAQAMGGEQITLTGTGFDGVTEVVHGGASVFDPDFFAFSNTELLYIAPISQTQTLGPTDVLVRNALGPSNSIQIDLTATAPPQLDAELVGTTLQPYTWTFGGTPGHTAFLILSLDTQTFPFQGTDILLNLLILHTTSLTGAGTDTLTITLPTSALGLSFFTQVATIDGGFQGASAIVGTVVPF